MKNKLSFLLNFLRLSAYAIGFSKGFYRLTTKALFQPETANNLKREDCKMLSNEQVKCLSQSVANTAINERKPIKKPFCDSKNARWFVRCDRNHNIVTWYETDGNNAFVKYYDSI